MAEGSTSAAERAEIERRLAGALEIARDAAERLRAHFRRGPARIDTKRDGSVVTEADRETEAAIGSALEAAFPGDGRLGEEHGEVAGSTGYRWVVDPIDGTVSFVRGVPLFGTLIGLERAGEPVAGVIAIPGLNEMVWGAPGHGAWRSLAGEQEAARVSQTAELNEALFCTTSTGYYRKADAMDAFGRLTAGFRRMRGWSDCYAYALLATGRCDAVVEPAINWWDIAAPIAVIEAAGGHFTDWAGRQIRSAGSSVASNGAIHNAALQLLSVDG